MNPVAPNQSQAHLALRQCASSAALEPALRRFLWEINAHWQLVALPIVADNVREMLELAQENWDLDLVDWGLESWPKVLDWIAENKSELAAEAGGGFASGFSAKGEHPVMGEGMLRHSVYATLCNSHVNPRWMETYRLLQAHLLLAKITVTRQHTSCAEYESYADLPALLEEKANPYQGALAVRLISEDWNAVLLRNLEEKVRLPPLGFLGDLVSVVPSAAGDINRYQHLVTFLSKAFHQSVQKKHGHPKGGGSDSRRKRFHGGRTDFWLAAQSTDVSLEDEDDKRNTRRGHHSTTVRIRHKGVQAEERLDIDDCPGEDEEDEDLDSTDFEDTDFQRSPGSFHEVSAAEAMQVQMANQNFPWSYGALTINEIVPLIWQRSQQMANILANSVLTSEQLEELEILALAQVMFWTSSSVAQARGLKVLHRTTSGRNAMLSLLPKTGSQIAQWRIRSPLPNYRRQQAEVPMGMDRARIDYLHLPDVVDGSFLVQAFVQRETRFQANEKLQKHGETVASNPSPRVFRRPLAWYRKQFQSLVGRLDSNTRLTESRLSRFLFSRILAASGGDLSATAIVTGNDVPLSRVKLFYACPSVSRLQTLYADVVIGVQDELLRAVEQGPRERTGRSANVDDTYIGNRLCPTRIAVRQAIRKLQAEIQRTWQPATNQEHQRHHNLLTLYTLWMFAYTTGVRGVRTPYLDLSEIDPEFRLGTLTDKDSGVGYKTRLVWMTPMLLEQMRLYKDFASRTPQAHRTRHLPCFFLDEGLKPVEVRPRTLAPMMREFLPFPVNIHRRFVSSELLDAGCPSEIVSAWMGHWHRGEEPWGKFSSFSFHEYGRVLESFLCPLLADLGFRAIQGHSHFKLKEPA